MPATMLFGRVSSMGGCGVAEIDRSGGVAVRFLFAGSPPREDLAGNFLFLSMIFAYPKEILERSAFSGNVRFVWIRVLQILGVKEGIK